MNRLGKRAGAYVAEHARVATSGVYLIPDLTGTPAGVVRTLTRLYGPPATIDRGEIAYWAVPAEDVSDD